MLPAHIAGQHPRLQRHIVNGADRVDLQAVRIPLSDPPARPRGVHPAVGAFFNRKPPQVQQLVHRQL
ncbi:hypothetical protein ACIQPR_09960 [Streptomyces sp. NPDC091280]|uniref:hypothetical protein n=1 Tax=Streptomyces sp. NPDC091280 TaxID=3365984 RepID=UPI0037F12FC5